MIYLRIVPTHSFLNCPPKSPAQSSAKLPVEQTAQQIIATCWDLRRLAFNQAAQSRASWKKGTTKKIAYISGTESLLQEICGQGWKGSNLKQQNGTVRAFTFYLNMIHEAALQSDRQQQSSSSTIDNPAFLNHQ